MKQYIYMADSADAPVMPVATKSTVADAKAEVSRRFDMMCRLFRARGCHIAFATISPSHTFTEWTEIQVTTPAGVTRFYGVGFSEKSDL